MSITGGDIRAKTFPRVTPAQAAAMVGLILVAATTGLLVGRVTAPSGEPMKGAVTQSRIATTWLADTPAYRARVMEKMNEILATQPTVLGSAETPIRVMRHMNRILAEDTTALSGYSEARRLASETGSG